MVDEEAEDGQATPAAKAGWHPDPQGSGSLFYWNGSAWTGTFARPRPQPPNDPTKSGHRKGW
jgi:hypothetical protein